MAVYAGDTASESISLGVAGQTFTTVYANGPAGAWTPTITEPATGVYAFAYVVTAAGSWVWVGTSSITGDTVTVTFDVDAAVDLYTPTSVRTTSRAALRQRIADELGDLEQLSATADGTTTTFVDALHVPTGSQGFGGRELVLTSGTYAGTVLRATASSGITHAVTFEPALPGIVAAGVTADVYNERSRGFRVDEYHRVINRVIDGAYPIARTRISVVLGTLGADGVLAAASAMEEIDALEVDDQFAGWIPLPRARHRAYDGWRADDFANQVTLDEGLAMEFTGRSVRAIGTGRHPQLAVDADVTTLDPEWVVWECCARLCRSGADRDGTRSQYAMAYEQKAQDAQHRIRTRRRSGSTRVRTT